MLRDQKTFKNLGDGVERTFDEICRRILKPDDIAFDVGANIGVTAAILSQHLPMGVIQAFEPAPSVYSALAANIETNGIVNVLPHQLALSERPGTVRFSENSAFSHIDSAGAVQVPCDTLDRVVADLALQRLDFIKIDTEGFDWAVLKGAREALRRFSPAVYLEFNSWCLLAFADVNPRRFVEWLFQEFNTVCVVRAGGTGPLVKRLTPDGILGFLYDNLLHRGCVSDLLVTNDPAVLTNLL